MSAPRRPELDSSPTPALSRGRRFVFLDRDGTLVRDHGYTHRIEDYALLPGVGQGLRRLGAAGFRLAIVTNQSGIGRGYYDEAAFQRFQAHLCAELAREGITIERSFFCPHLPDAGCACRKPAPGMLLQAAAELGADLAASWLIGDAPSDLEAARRAGCRGAVLVHPDRATPHDVTERARVAPDVAAAAELILAEPSSR